MDAIEMAGRRASSIWSHFRKDTFEEAQTSTRASIGLWLEDHVFKRFNGWIPPLMISICQQLFPIQASEIEPNDAYFQDEDTGVFLHRDGLKSPMRRRARRRTEGVIISFMAIPFVLASALMTTVLSVSLAFVSCVVLFFSLLLQQPDRLSFLTGFLKKVVDLLVKKANSRNAPRGGEEEGKPKSSVQTADLPQGSIAETFDRLYSSYSMSPQPLHFTEEQPEVSKTHGLKGPYDQTNGHAYLPEAGTSQRRPPLTVNASNPLTDDADGEDTPGMDPESELFASARSFGESVMMLPSEQPSVESSKNEDVRQNGDSTNASGFTTPLSGEPEVSWNENKLFGDENSRATNSTAAIVDVAEDAPGTTGRSSAPSLPSIPELNDLNGKEERDFTSDIPETNGSTKQNGHQTKTNGHLPTSKASESLKDKVDGSEDAPSYAAMASSGSLGSQELTATSGEMLSNGESPNQNSGSQRKKGRSRRQSTRKKKGSRN